MWSAVNSPDTANCEGVARDSDTETFIALKVGIDNWRWAGVPIYLRTGKRMAEGMRIISIAFKEAPRSMFPAGSGVGSQGPDHLTFDLADNSKVSLSFYGKRPGPGMKLDKLSMQFSTQEIDSSDDVLEAYERLILDAMRGDHTLFTTAEGIESLWERSERAAVRSAAGQDLPAGHLGTQRDSSADRTQRVAAAVRASVARGQEVRGTTQKPPHRRGVRGLLSVIAYLAFSRISTRRQRLVADSGRVSISDTRSPMPAMPFSSCALTFVVVRMILP